MVLSKLKHIFVIVILLVVDGYKTSEDDLSDKDNKLCLSPAQLVDLVQKELSQENETSQHELTSENSNSNENEDGHVTLSETVKDEERLKARKVWSRWSKWSKCSVTCGGGTFTRQRLCVAGRCAPGEREEQRRACALAPCSHLAGDPSAGSDAPDAPDAADGYPLHDDDAE